MHSQNERGGVRERGVGEGEIQKRTERKGLQRDRKKGERKGLHLEEREEKRREEKSAESIKDGRFR